MRIRLAVAVLALAMPAALVSGQAEITPAVPQDAVSAIVNAFHAYRVVGLGDTHGSERLSAFRLALLRDPRLAGVVDDVVVEFGASRYQDLIDRFVRGDTVAEADLRKVWEDTTAANPTWDRPIYEAVFRTVREVNAGRPPDQRMRVLLGDPPIDWDAVTTTDEYRALSLRRDSFAADLIEREVIARNRRALAIFGDGHFQARTERPPRSFGARLSADGIPFFAIASAGGRIAELQPDVSTWHTPAIASVRGTPIGAAEYDFFYGPRPPAAYWDANHRFEDHLDAVLYIGPVAADMTSPLTFPRCSDPAYVAMRVRRMEIAGMRPPAGAPSIAARISQDCRH
ncbi:MAG TPA: hypothetical protein VL173_10130 [Vicinamibacterales bacterium]|nr:hypothetical protein [Vicinamibacterales bacterium]